MIQFSVNGKPVSLDLDPDTPLIYALRNDLMLNGPKLGCAKGQCGACTVHLNDQVTRACVVPIKAVAGSRVTTLEGLGTPDKPHALQTAFIAEQALQCGYCTNGHIMQAAAFIKQNNNPSEEQVRSFMNANLCRCGCQPRVIRAVMRAAKDVRTTGLTDANQTTAQVATISAQGV